MTEPRTSTTLRALADLLERPTKDGAKVVREGIRAHADAWEAREKREREARYLLGSTPRNVAPPESLSLRIDAWLAASKPPGEGDRC